MTSVMWFRRDLRLRDNPALLAACADGAVLPLFVLDPALWGPAGPSRRAYLAASLASLDGDLRRDGGGLAVLEGDPVRRVVEAAREVGADRVHVAADFGPRGRRREGAAERAPAGRATARARPGARSAGAPGRGRRGWGGPQKGFSPFPRAGAEHGWRSPADPPAG